MATNTLAEPKQFFATHYRSKKDDSVKKYCAQIREHCSECGQTDGKHTDKCSKPARLWFGAKGDERGSTWLECAELVIAGSEDEAWKHHKSHCNL